MDTAEDKITKAKVSLMSRHPFYAGIAMRMEFIEAEWCKTMATDGRNIYWGRKFTESLTKAELTGVIAHEVLHGAFLHMLRQKGRHHHLWNVACDAAINHILLESGLTLPTPGIHGPEWAKYKDWPAEKIYDDLLQNATIIKVCFPSPDGEGGEEGKDEMWGGFVEPTDENGNSLSKAEQDEMEAEMKVAVQQAAEQAKARGKLPSSLTGLIEAVGKPKINWKDYIQNWVSGKIPDDYTWTRPNRNMMTNFGVYMPRMQLNGAGVGVLSIDTSGSVSNDELRSYIREIVGVIELCNPEKLYIIQHDAIVQDVYLWEAGEEFTRLKIKGRGGTCIQPSFDYAEKKIDDPIDWMICFTDMGIGDFPRVGPDWPVLWCATGPDIAPFGTYLPLKDAMAI